MHVNLNKGIPRGIRVEPMRKTDLVNVARKFREVICEVGIHEALDVVRLLEHKLFKYGVLFECLSKHELPAGTEALTHPDSSTIMLSEDVYDALCDQSHQLHGRARFTAAHEVGHLILHQGIALARSNEMHSFYEDSEWQADFFASELLMPSKGCIGLTVTQIQEKYNVSHQAALNKFNSLK